MLRRAEFWGGLFWLGVGVFVTWQGWLLELGTLHEPGSGFVFFWPTEWAGQHAAPNSKCHRNPSGKIM